MGCNLITSGVGIVVGNVSPLGGHLYEKGR